MIAFAWSKFLRGGGGRRIGRFVVTDASTTRTWLACAGGFLQACPSELRLPTPPQPQQCRAEPDRYEARAYRSTAARSPRPLVMHATQFGSAKTRLAASRCPLAS